MWVTRKIFTRAAAKLFIFNQFSGDFIFSLLDYFPFFVFLFFFSFFACLSVFWNKEYIFRYTFDYAAGWGIKKFSSGRFPETRLLTWLEWDTFHPSLPTCLFLFSSYVTLLFTYFFCSYFNFELLITIQLSKLY